MARTLTAAAKTESQKSSGAKPFHLLKLSFDSGTERVWSGRGTITFNAETYVGIGDLGKITPTEESAEQRAFGITIELSGIPASRISLALQEDVIGRKCELWLGFRDANHQIVADPVLIFRGRMDAAAGKLGETGVVTITAESRLIDWDRPRVRLYTDATQQERFPDDLGLEFVAPSVGRQINWGVGRLV